MCKYFKWPKSRTDFWKSKLNKNAENDNNIVKKLKTMNWRICLVWECSIRGADKDLKKVIKVISDWLRSDVDFMEVKG